MKNCPKCNKEMQHITIYDMQDNKVGEYYYCLTVTIEDHTIKETGCEYKEWLQIPNSMIKPEKEFKDRYVFVGTKKKYCEKCGGPIGFYKNENNKWVPCEINGDDHWDICRENLISGKYGKKKVFKRKSEPAWTKSNKTKVFYTGDIPPWK